MRSMSLKRDYPTRENPTYLIRTKLSARKGRRWPRCKIRRIGTKLARIHLVIVDELTCCSLYSKANLEKQISDNYQILLDNATKVFDSEMKQFNWLNEEFIENIMTTFVEQLDRAFDDWRRDYKRLQEHLDRLHRDAHRQYHEEAKFEFERVTKQMDRMRNGGSGYYVYRYLGGIGFLPGYAFPENSVSVSYYFGTEEKKIVRSRILALREFAPFNTVYVDGGTYRINSVNTVVGVPWQRIKLCPNCKAVLSGDKVTQSACTRCGLDLTTEHAIEHAMPMADVVAIRRSKIGSDEEERLRSGYIVNEYYDDNPEKTSSVEIRHGDNVVVLLSYEHNGRVIGVNEGLRQDVKQGKNGFAFCNACRAWINDDDKQIERHYGDNNHKDECRKNGTISDLMRGVYLISDDMHDQEFPQNFQKQEMSKGSKSCGVGETVSLSCLENFLPNNKL